MRCARAGWAFCAAVAAMAFGCKKEQASPTGGAQPAARGAPAAAPVTARSRTPAQTPYDGFVDMGEIWRKLQGTWLVGGSFLSAVPAIWDIRGDEITVVDSNGQLEKTRIQLLAPCRAKIGGVYHHLVFDGDTLYAGLGNSGVRAGGVVVGCFSSGVFVYQDGRCQVHDYFFDRIRTRDADCRIEKGPTGDAFAATDVNRKPKPIYGTERMEIRGNVLMTAQMSGNKAERVADLQAAKARIAELRAKQR